MRASPTTSRFGFLMRLSALTGSVLLVLALTSWLWHIGWLQKQSNHIQEAALQVTQKAQFSVKDIVVEGRQQTGKDVLSAALAINIGAPILSFDTAAAQARIAKLPWVASVVIERRLPDIVFVHLTERTPMARWQHEGHIMVIDSEGSLLPNAKPEQFTQLPLVVGSEAPSATKELLDDLNAFPAVMSKMTAAVRVSERRWDIHLQPKITARLPENDIMGALKRLSPLITEQKILERDIVAIDLRFTDRLVIESGSSITNNPAGDMRL